MRKLFMMISLGLLMTACGGNSSKADSADDTVSGLAEEVTLADSNEQQASVVEPEPEPEDDGIYNPPFKVTLENTYRSKGWEYHDTYVFSVLKNGRLTGSKTGEYRKLDLFWGDHDPWIEDDPVEFGGKWSTSSIAMGDGTLKVYCLDRSDTSFTYYLPATCDYIWACEQAWYYCENWDLSKALKIISVEKL